jgi:multidrug efflux pump subunit AcrA (membrane-fusion protein)
MKNQRKYWIAAAVLILLSVLVYAIVNARNAAQKQKRPNSVLIKTEKPSTRDFNVSLKYTGDVTAVQMANIYSKVSGNIEKLYCDIGSAVRNRQLLAVVDSTELHQQYQQAAANYYNVKSNYQRTK